MMDFMLMDNDLAIDNGDLTLCNDEARAISQAISIRLKTFAGEWFLDTNIGLPYLTHILGKKNSEHFLRKVVSDSIAPISGVMDLKDLSFREDQRSRKAIIKFTAVLSDQTSITVNESIGVK